VKREEERARIYRVNAWREGEMGKAKPCELCPLDSRKNADMGLPSRTAC
jgi:hypothetical protein